MTVPAECQNIVDHIAEMEGERRDLQLELQEAATNEKAGLVWQIKALNKQLAVADNQLTDCLAAHRGPPPPPPLASTLSAVVTLTTSKPEAAGPYAMPIEFGCIFDGNRTVIALTSFPDIATSFDTPVGRNTTTVSKVAGGSGSYSAGQIDMSITLHFDQSIDLPFYEEDSDLPLVMSTSPPGSAVDATGAVTISGTGTFVGGYLAGATGTVTITGTFSPVP